ncbi:MAG: cell wall-active antibiotics response protein [Cyclobacteriaceae bacterium]|nr:cell wall-active antibiotics response protein [Cyclobacteriaceae bacterium]
METNPMENNERKERFINSTGRQLGGLVLVAVGSLFLARQAGVELPYWLFGWETILIGIGIYIGARHSFKPGGWIVPILIGGFFLADDVLLDMNLRQYLWPSLIIGLGLFMILGPMRKKSRWDTASISQDDIIDAVSVFGGTKRNIISKDFKGGDITTVFGGTDLNFMQADINNSATIDVTTVFGGTKIIVPPHWNVKSEVVCILGGLDDKRPILKDMPETGKTLVLTGTCVFGGIDIKSY